MKKLVFRILFWILWPLIWIYAPLRASARILVVCGNQFLVVKPYFGSGQWQLPGGGIRLSEDPASAAIREVYEETGLQLKSVSRLTDKDTYIEYGLPFRHSIFFAKLDSKTDLSINKEISEALWVDISINQGLSAHVVGALSAFNRSNLLKYK